MNFTPHPLAMLPMGRSSASAAARILSASSEPAFDRTSSNSTMVPAKASQALPVGRAPFFAWKRLMNSCASSRAWGVSALGFTSVGKSELNTPLAPSPRFFAKSGTPQPPDVATTAFTLRSSLLA